MKRKILLYVCTKKSYTVYIDNITYVQYYKQMDKSKRGRVLGATIFRSFISGPGRNNDFGGKIIFYLLFSNIVFYNVFNVYKHNVFFSGFPLNPPFFDRFHKLPEKRLETLKNMPGKRFAFNLSFANNRYFIIS